MSTKSISDFYLQKVLIENKTEKRIMNYNYQYHHVRGKTKPIRIELLKVIVFN